MTAETRRPRSESGLARIAALLGRSWGLIAGCGLVAAAGLATLRQPEFGDGQAYMIPNALHMMQSFDPFIEDEVHPPFFFLLEGVAFRIFGPRIEALHALSLIFSLGTIAAVYTLGTALAGSSVGGMAAFLVAAWPPFLVQTTLIRLDIPVAAMSLAALVAAHRGWTVAYILAGSLAPLTKAPGVLAPAVLAATAAAGAWRPRFSRWVLWLPVLAYGGWLVACKLRFGWFLYPENVGDFSLTRNPRAGLEGLVYWARRLVIDQWAWAVFVGAVVMEARNRPYLIATVAAGVLAGAVLPVLDVSDGAAVGMLAALTIMGWSARGFWRVFPVLACGIVGLFFTYHYRFPRYMLPAWPGLALLCARGLSRLRGGWVVAAAGGTLMMSASFSPRMWDMEDWSFHESTFGYRSTVRSRKSAADYLLHAAGDGAILAGGKAAECVTVPALGYVRTPLRVVSPKARCEEVRNAAYYFELSTRSRGLEREVWSRLRQCGVRTAAVMAHAWPGPYGEGNTRIYRLQAGEAGTELAGHDRGR